MSVVNLSTIKARLNKTLTVDDAELQAMIDAAESYYAEMVGPLSGSVTETFSGGGSSVVLRARNVTAITSAAYTNGTAITVGDLSLDATTGIVYWGVNTAGAFTYGTRNVTITYTVATPPLWHQEIIAADVAGYFEATQRGGGSIRPSFPGEGEYDAAYAATPATLFPRIAELARSFPSVA